MANSVDPNEMPHNVYIYHNEAFHQGLHYLLNKTITREKKEKKRKKTV